MPFDKLSKGFRKQEDPDLRNVRDALVLNKLPDLEGLEVYEGDVVVKDYRTDAINPRLHKLRVRILIGAELGIEKGHDILANQLLNFDQHGEYSSINRTVLASLFFHTIRFLTGNKISAHNKDAGTRALGLLIDAYNNSQNGPSPVPLVIVHAHGFSTIFKRRPSIVTNTGGRTLEQVFDALGKNIFPGDQYVKIPAALVVCNEAKLSIHHPRFNILYNKGLVGLMERPQLVFDDTEVLPKIDS